MSETTDQNSTDVSGTGITADTTAPVLVDPAPSEPVVVEPDALADLRDAAFSFADFAQGIAESLLRPWIAYQIAIAIGVFALAHFVIPLLPQNPNFFMGYDAEIV